MSSDKSYSPKKKASFDSGYQLFLSENLNESDTDIDQTAQIQILHSKYQQLSNEEKQNYRIRAQGVRFPPKKKKNPLTKNSNNYQQDPQFFSNLSSTQINLQQSSNQVMPNYKMSAKLQHPKKLIAKPIIKKDESSDQDSDSESNPISTNKQSLCVISPSKYSSQPASIQNQIVPNQSQQNFYYNQIKQPQINNNYQPQIKIKNKVNKNLPPPSFQPSQNISDLRIHIESNEISKFRNMNPQIQKPIGKYPSNIQNSIFAKKQFELKFVQAAEGLFEDENVDARCEADMSQDLLNQIDLKKNFYFSLIPFDTNCLDNYPSSFSGF